MKTRTTRRSLWTTVLALGALIASGCATHALQEPVWTWDPTDPRLGLPPSGDAREAESAAWGMELIVHEPTPEGFGRHTDPSFRGNLAIIGNYNGITIYDISDPSHPSLRVSLLCPGSQGDVSVFGDLLFMSNQAVSSRIDCGTEGVEGEVSLERFRGVRIFDITDIDTPRQVAAVQTCRGSHTHTIVSDPSDPSTVYVYNSGTSAPRPGEELEECVDERDPANPLTAYWSIDVIEVPLARPEEARIIAAPRLFADPETGRIDGLFPGGDHGAGTQESRATDRCHDVTAYPEIGLALGACAGNGLLIDISNPADPVRIDEVIDTNFAFWHSATFNNDGTKAIFTDEWGGGGNPRCRDIDPPEWGANAVLDIVDGRMVHRSYYKVPVPVVPTCVAHNGSLIPVPGRDIKVQAWYQGGISVFDFTDSGNPIEIAFFNRGPGIERGGFWSAYWYNGYVYGTESRGLDVLQLVPNEHLSRNEIEAAASVEMDKMNAQHQRRFEWPVSFPVTLSYLDQVERADAIAPEAVGRLREELALAERLPAGEERRASADRLVGAADEIEAGPPGSLTAGAMHSPTRMRARLAESLRELAETLR